MCMYGFLVSRYCIKGWNIRTYMCVFGLLVSRHGIKGWITKLTKHGSNYRSRHYLNKFSTTYSPQQNAILLTFEWLQYQGRHSLGFFICQQKMIKD